MSLSDQELRERMVALLDDYGVQQALNEMLESARAGAVEIVACALEAGAAAIRARLTEALADDPVEAYRALRDVETIEAFVTAALEAMRGG